MSNKVNQSPQISPPEGQSYFYATLIDVLREHANGINALVSDQIAPSVPVLLPSYLKTALPSAVTYKNGMIIVSNETGGLTPAFSDGTNWRRVADRAVVS